nr:hypothetical protein BaRGS_009650 [Batillaria attramentaria]
MSRYQLSKLLYMFISMASDMMEIFFLFDEENVRRDPGLTFVILFIWSISLFQLAINLTATKSITLNDKRYDFCSAVKRTEIWGLLVTFFLQDGPFLVVRLYALICYETYTYTIIFFTCKNMLNASLCIYRFIILVGQVRNQK